jgi:LuxR family maltose regulon positive regulatory protein
VVPGLGDAEHHLREGAALAHRIGRPYLEIACLAELGFASKIRPNATTRRRCQEAITLAERHGWGAEPIVAPALVTLAGNLALTGDFDEGERWLRRTERALETDTGPGIRLLVHLVTRLLQAGRGRHQAAFEAFSAVERLQSQLADSHGLASQVTGWLLATQARLGQPNALGDQRAANMATERALALAEPERLVLPFAMIGAGELLEALPRHQTAHAALRSDILDVVHGASLTADDQPPSPPTDELSPTELRVLRYLPTNLSRPEIARELSVSVNTVNTHIRNIYAKLQASDRSSAVQRARELRLLSTGRTR